MTGAAIVLNGASSAGKSSIVRAVLAIAPATEAIAMDDVLAALPTESFGTPEGLSFIVGTLAGAPCTEIVAGPLVRAALSQMHVRVAALVADGRRVIVDDVILTSDDEADYRRLIPADALGFVAVRAPLPIIEARERARGDRMLGLARWQFDRVHAGRPYDVEIDTSVLSPQESAAAIVHRFGWSPALEQSAPAS